MKTLFNIRTQLGKYAPCLILGVLLGLLATPLGVAAQEPKKILVVTVTTGFPHSSIPTAEKTLKPEEKWVDQRAPDGVTIIAQFEQAHPSQYPGVLTGDETKAMSLFNLEVDPAEQHDVADQHPEVVARLKALYDAMNKQVQLAERNQPGGKAQNKEQ